MSCLACHHAFVPPFSWRDLFTVSVLRSEVLLPVEQWLCVQCRSKLVLLRDGCLLCSRSVHDLDSRYVAEYRGGQICFDCRRWLEWEEAQQSGRVLTCNRSVAQYNAWMQDLLTRYKFRGDERLRYFFASLLYSHWNGMAQQMDKVDVIAPIPLSAKRLKERGFNQSALVARLLADKIGIAYTEKLLLRRDGEDKQSKKGREERLKEMLQKFLNNPEQNVDIHGKNILLVDDIYTTGATLYAAAYLLKKRGAKHIYAYTLAR